MIDKLKRFTADSANLDELIEMSALQRLYRAEYERAGAEIPDWIDATGRTIQREIKTRQADAVERRLMEARSRLLSLATPEEKRQKLTEEIKALEASLQLS